MFEKNLVKVKEHWNTKLKGISTWTHSYVIIYTPVNIIDLCLNLTFIVPGSTEWALIKL